MPDSAHPIRLPAPLVDWWTAKTTRERHFLTAMGVIAGAVVLWVALWQPLVHDSEGMRTARAREVAALADARRAVAETAALARTPTAPAPPDARADLDRVLAQHGLRKAITQLAWQDGRAHLVFGAVDFDALIIVLEALQREARLRVIEATLTGRVEPRTVRAEITLGR